MYTFFQSAEHDNKFTQFVKKPENRKGELATLFHFYFVVKKVDKNFVKEITNETMAIKFLLTYPTLFWFPLLHNMFRTHKLGKSKFLEYRE